MKTIRVENQEIQVEQADTLIKRIKGLSFRKKGKMLFIFPKPGKNRIDMMFLSKPLYLYFFDKDKRLIEKQKAKPWTWNPKTWKLYKPKKEYQYLIESFEPLNIKQNDKLKISGQKR